MTVVESRGAENQADERARAYAPLGRRTLAVQLVVLVVAEIGLFSVYGTYDSRFHWGAHFLVALIATSVWLSAVLLVKAAPARGQLLLVLVVHLFAMAPDLVFRAGVPHSLWMNVFLGHIAVHYIPGGDRTWLVLAVLAAGGYCLLLSRWLGARHAEAAAGLAPGIGIGGAAVLRPQADPTSTPLAHRHHGPADDGGSGVPVLVLHGLGGTARSLAGLTDALAGHGVLTLAPDLLGHGESRRIGTRFRLPEQVDALVRLLDGHDLVRVDVVAHSYGAAVAAALAGAHPDRVRQVLLVCPPVFADTATAQQVLGERSWLTRRTVGGAPLAGVVCGAMCLLRVPLARAAPRLVPDVPAAVARAGVAHSYPAYRDALAALFGPTLRDWLAAPAVPTVVVVAADDVTAPPAMTRSVPRAEWVRLVSLEGDHLVPVTDPARVGAVVADALRTG